MLRNRNINNSGKYDEEPK